jgi:hypothetical protein
VEVGWDEGVVWIGAKEGGVRYGGEWNGVHGQKYNVERCVRAKA